MSFSSNISIYALITRQLYFLSVIAILCIIIILALLTYPKLLSVSLEQEKFIIGRLLDSERKSFRIKFQLIKFIT
jgi:hypothetical protein